ncbi:class F sortase [Streptomyces sp. NPDC058067]|uniref:Class F sortase n=1 Tax=Streptomyces antnestii TaxID=2494256 RepID=A0A3S3UEM6_9ACTN|nr:class F sortase [Streptomyces sp. San01]RVU22368.1 class F sortase [Streptomyces sp. San01]
MAARLPSPARPESAPPGRRFRTGAWIAWSLGIVFLAVSLFGGGHDEQSGPSGTTGSAATHAPAPAPSSSGVPAEGKHLPRATPTRLLIPKIGVDAPFTGLAIGPTGQLQPPPADDTNLVGWQADGVSPGEAGTAIIAGHVDTKTSAAVFAGLSDLKKGDHFTVKRSDKRTASFVVDSVEEFAKDDFPDKRVYGDTPQAQVRLITCAGEYDRSVKDYTDNLVVFAHLV